MKRREFLALLGACSAWPLGCHSIGNKESIDVSTIEGDFANLNPIPAYALRKSHFDLSRYTEVKKEVYDTIIVGGGLSGLAALWKLKKAGVERVLLLEVGDRCGGTSVSGKLNGVEFPWGAHYIHVPRPEAQCVHELLGDIGVIEGYDARNWPLVESGAILHWPHERLFINGEWQDGLEPLHGASAVEKEDLLRFRDMMLRFALKKGRDGKPAFTLPLRHSSQDPRLLSLDRITFSTFLRDNGFKSRPLMWYTNYACRDGYGSLANQVSAWAGIHYFACRNHDYRLKNTYPAHTLTWPEGNARLVSGLMNRASEEQIRTNTLAMRIDRIGRQFGIAALNVATEESALLRAKSVVYAGKLHTAPYVFPNLPYDQRTALQRTEYSPWLVAAIRLNEVARFTSTTYWNNVLFDSPSLGYFSAQHQENPGNRGQVLMYHLPFVENLQQARQDLLRGDHRRWVEFIVQDLGRADRYLVESIKRIDLIRWVHGMQRPVPGYLWGVERMWRRQAFEGSFFASCDRTGLPLFEEAVFSGIQAAEEAMSYLEYPYTTSLGEYATGG